MLAKEPPEPNHVPGTAKGEEMVIRHGREPRLRLSQRNPASSARSVLSNARSASSGLGKPLLSLLVMNTSARFRLAPRTP